MERILLVTAEPWARNALSLLRQCPGDFEVIHAIDGAQGLYYMSQSIYAGTPYQLLILTAPLPKISVESTLASIRAIEKGLNRPPYPCLICTSDPTPEGLLASHPQTLHLQTPEGPQAASMVTAATLQIMSRLRRFQEEIQ